VGEHLKMNVYKSIILPDVFMWVNVVSNCEERTWIDDVDCGLPCSDTV
jgi:hypothetical protein